jgi:hypothetical protein
VGDLLIEILRYAGVLLLWAVLVPLVFAVIGFLLAGAPALVRISASAVQRRRGRAHRRRIRPSAPRSGSASTADPRWSCSLVVGVDETTGTLVPRVQLWGDDLPRRAHVRLELVSDRGVVCHRVARRLPSDASRTDIALEPFPVPDGARLDDVLGWRWDVVLDDRRGERARWRERLHPPPGLNREAELDYAARPG